MVQASILKEVSAYPPRFSFISSSAPTFYEPRRFRNRLPFSFPVPVIGNHWLYESICCESAESHVFPTSFLPNILPRFLTPVSQ